MIPPTFLDYFLAMAGAGGALIGLLFVAVSINPERTFGPGAHPLRQGTASAAYTALANGFFVSVWALVPGDAVGYVGLVMGLIGLSSSLGFAVELFRSQWRAERPFALLWRRLARALIIALLSLGLYAYEALESVFLLQRPHTVGYVYGLAGALFAVYAIGLARAWQLLGAPRTLLKWLDPLRDLPDDDSLIAAESPNSATAEPLTKPD